MHHEPDGARLSPSFQRESDILVNWKTIATVTVCMLMLGAGYWYHLISSFESDLGTNNSIQMEDNPVSLSNASDDHLLSISFDQGDDDLGWTHTSIVLVDENREYACTVSGQSSIEQQDGKVQSRLNSDGQTFTIMVDATSEANFTKLSLANMKESGDENHSLRFSKTDIFLSENLSWIALDNVEFDEVTEIPDGNFSNDTTERLEWYDYDFSTHRVMPKDQVYLIEEGQTIYKIQFLNYYNEADESRYVTLIVSHLSGEPIPALNDPNLIQSSPCIIVDDDNVWYHNETIELHENGFDICSTNCTLEVQINYESRRVKGSSQIALS